MTDTPKHIQELQLKFWLSKTPSERFMQFLVDNDAMHKAIISAKIKMEAAKNEMNLPVDKLMQPRKE